MHRNARLAVGAALITSLMLGSTMRWILAGRLDPGWDFGHLRHAHSHLGFYGLLLPLAWLAWRQAGQALPHPILLWTYALATLLAFLGFLREGYGPAAIVGSSLVAAIWLLSAWPLRRRWSDPNDPLAMVLPGILAAEACVPPIAMFLRTSPVMGQAFVTTFLTLLLLAVAIPSAMAARDLRAPWSALLIGALAGSASFALWPSPWMRLGLALYALLLARAAWRDERIGHLRTTWFLTSAGLLAVAAGALPTTRPVVIGAIHFLVLGPVLGSLAPGWLPRRIPAWSWWLELAGVLLLSLPLVAQGLGAGPWTLDASAIGGSWVLLWWIAACGYAGRRSSPSSARTGSAGRPRRT